MLVEAVVWGGSTLITGLNVGYYFLGKYDEKSKRNLKNILKDINVATKKKFKETENNDVEPQALKKSSGQHNNFFVEKDGIVVTVEDELYRLARIAMETSYFSYDKIKPPKCPKLKDSPYDNKGLIYKLEYEIWQLDCRSWERNNVKTHPFDLTLVDFIEKQYVEINREHEIGMLIYIYSCAWDTYEQIIKEARELEVCLSDEVKKEIHNGITQFIIDYLELEYRINKHQKQLKDEMDAVTNNSFMQRLQFEREYINKVRNKEEFDLTLNNI